MRFPIVLVCFFMVVHTFAQVGGETVYQFLNLPTSARQVALGGEVLTLRKDVNQPIWNPAAISSELDKQLAVNYTSYLAGISIGSVSYAKVISRRFGTLHGSITYLNYGTLIGADENGVETGSFSASDLAVSVGYAYTFPYSSLTLGVNTKLIQSTIQSFNSFAIAADIALQYASPYDDFSIALVARNMGSQVQSFNGTQESLPFKISLGADYRLAHVPLVWYVTFDNLQQWNLAVPNPSNQEVDLNGNVTPERITFFSNLFRHFVVGAELFPDSIINLRAGYNFRRASELRLQNARTFSGISLGFGVKMNSFRFNYAFSKFHAATNASTFSLYIDLDR